MTAMIQNDEDKEWMQPLLDLRNELDPKREERESRDFRRMSGLIQLYYRKVEKTSEEREEALIRGPYTQHKREYWLSRVLEAQALVRKHGPEVVRNIELISKEELEEIRRTWVVDKHEFEDSLPRLYEQATGQPYPGPESFEDQRLFGPEELELLEEVCDGERLQFELLRELISTEHRYRTKMSRRGLYDSLEKSIKKHFYEDEEDALDFASRRKRSLDQATMSLTAPELTDQEAEV